MNRPPPTIEKKLLLLLHRVFVHLRNRSLGDGNAEFAELGDAFEILPGFLVKWEDEHLEFIRRILTDYQERAGIAGTFLDGLHILDMDDEHFEKLYGQGW